ncbi:MAG: ethylbenzene dehydrogenase-related protein [Deltaproteobacteria bacterium]|nr:ethylbenzene dehydrogenase-related protein [Deltaproteobacteria bacterium]
MRSIEDNVIYDWLFRVTTVVISVAMLAFFGVTSKAGSSPEGSRGEVKPEFTTFKPKDVPVNWEEISANKIRLFYPGQASWDWLTSPQKDFAHPGAAVIKAGVTCRTCHVKGGAGPDEGALGKKLVPKGLAEDNPIQGKRPVIDLAVKAAYDAQNMYFWIQWQSTEAGVYHNVIRFDGKKWVGYGGPKPDKELGLYEDRITLLIGHKQGSPGYVTADTGSAAGFQSAGCFITCHDSMREMRYDAAKNKKGVREVFPKHSDIRKYILITRNAAQKGDPKALKGVTEAEGRWANLKSKDKLAAMRKKGQFLDMWMWRGARSGPVGYVDDIWVFDYRNSDKGKSPWRRQRPKNLNAKPPKGFMFNPEVVDSSRLGGGKYAIMGGNNPVEVLKRQETISFITSLGKRAVKYDPKLYKPKEGDLLFQRVLRPPTLSRGDIQAYGTFYKKAGEKMGTWTLILRRKLDTGHPEDDIILKDGEVYPSAFAVFDDHVSNRRHQVSFEHTLGLGVKADIVARKVR